MGMNQMPLKMLNRNDPIKKCFEADMNFKGICNQSTFVTTAGMKCARESVFVWEHTSMIDCISVCA